MQGRLEWHVKNSYFLETNSLSFMKHSKWHKNYTVSKDNLICVGQKIMDPMTREKIFNFSFPKMLKKFNLDVRHCIRVDPQFSFQQIITTARSFSQQESLVHYSVMSYAHIHLLVSIKQLSWKENKSSSKSLLWYRRIIWTKWWCDICSWWRSPAASPSLAKNMIPSVISTWNELLVKAIMVFDRYSGAPFTKKHNKVYSN